MWLFCNNQNFAGGKKTKEIGTGKGCSLCPLYKHNAPIDECKAMLRPLAIKPIRDFLAMQMFLPIYQIHDVQPNHLLCSSPVTFCD